MSLQLNSSPENSPNGKLPKLHSLDLRGVLLPFGGFDSLRKGCCAHPSKPFLVETDISVSMRQLHPTEGPNSLFASMYASPCIRSMNFELNARPVPLHPPEVLAQPSSSLKNITRLGLSVPCLGGEGPALINTLRALPNVCLLYTSDAADE